MIFSENPDPKLNEFAKLLESGRRALNEDAKKRPDYYKTRNAQKLEADVLDVMTEVSQGTCFEKSLTLISGHKFPDIIAEINKNKYYGVEVKSTSQNHWESFGNSVLESSRCENVERIFIMFGKLASPIEFKARPYEECLSDVTVTHYPRYHVNMNLNQGETIFDKIHKSYDEVRGMENPVAPFADYYRSQLKEGESLWWLNNNPDDENENTGMKVRLWRVLNKEEKKDLTIKGYAWFPEIIASKSPKKYERYTLWLVTAYGVVHASMRDKFSAGGCVNVVTRKGKVYKNLPQVFSHLHEYRDEIMYELMTADQEFLRTQWKIDAKIEDRLEQWIDLVSAINPSIGIYDVKKILKDIFS